MFCHLSCTVEGLIYHRPNGIHVKVIKKQEKYTDSRPSMHKTSKFLSSLILVLSCSLHIGLLTFITARRRGR